LGVKTNRYQRLAEIVGKGCRQRTSLCSNLWEIALDSQTGKPVNKPRPITNWDEVRLDNLSTTADGKRLAFTKGISQFDVDVADLEKNGRKLSNSRRLTLDERDDMPSAWMPDSKSVLFASNRNGNFDLFKQGLDQRRAEPIASGVNRTQAEWWESGPPAQVTPDGEWILYFAEAHTQLMKMPISGGTPRHVITQQRTFDVVCARVHGKRCVLIEGFAERKELSVTEFDPMRGKGHELVRIETDPSALFYTWDLSSDGSRLAIAKSGPGADRIQIIRLEGGRAHDVRVKGWKWFQSINWAADETGWYVWSYTSPGSMLLYVDSQGQAQILRHAEAYSSMAIPSPDGRHLAFGENSAIANVWAFETDIRR